jgi:hypothetical protein
MAARQGATDAQIAFDALRQGLPHLTDPASLQGKSVGKEAEGTGIQTKHAKKYHEQPQPQTRTTSQAKQTKPLLLAADNTFAVALGTIPWSPFSNDWCRTWAADRTIMLRSTSKIFKGVVDKLRLPAAICLSSSFWKDARNGTAAEKLQFVMRQLTTLSTWCLITTLELPSCNIEGQDAERLAGVLAQCPTLAHFNLSAGYCASRAHRIGAAGAERLAEVLARCRSLAHLDLMDRVLVSSTNISR